MPRTYSVAHRAWSFVPESIRARARQRQIFWRAREASLAGARRRRSRAIDRLSALAPADCTHGLTQSHVLVCLANIDWDARRQRPQELMVALVEHGWTVYYVLPHARSWLPPGTARLTPVEPGVVEVEIGGNSLDAYRHPLTAAQQQQALAALADLARQAGFAHAVQMVEFPAWSFVGVAARDRWGWPIVYDCMDDWLGFPAVGAAQVGAERLLHAQADAVLVTSTTLAEVLADRYGDHRAELVPNGFSDARSGAARRSSRTDHVAGFIGALAEWLDYDLLEDLVVRMPDWSFVLVGDVFDQRADRLARHANVRMTGLLDHASALDEASRFSVGLIPFADNETTRTVDPVKLYEYLSVGVPVVARDLPQMRHYADHVTVATTAQEFEDALRDLDGADVPATTTAWLADQTWARRAVTVDDVMRNVLPSISVVIPSYRQVELTLACVASVVTHTETTRLQVIVVDDGSDDATVHALEAGLDSPVVDLVLLPENQGFAAACNAGLARATGDVVVLLNNDTLVTSGWAAPLIEQLANPGVGLVGPISNSVGNEALRQVEGLTALTYCDVGPRAMAAQPNGAAFDIPMLAFFCVAGTRQTWTAIGPLSHEFGIGMFEDDDYCMRVRHAGLRLICDPRSLVFHHGQATFSRLDDDTYRSLWRDNQQRFEAKWGAWEPHRYWDGA